MINYLQYDIKYSKRGNINLKWAHALRYSFNIFFNNRKNFFYLSILNQTLISMKICLPEVYASGAEQVVLIVLTAFDVGMHLEVCKRRDGYRVKVCKSYELQKRTKYENKNDI